MFKKSFAALAVLGCCRRLCHRLPDVTLYGVVDTRPSSITHQTFDVTGEAGTTTNTFGHRKPVVNAPPPASA